MSNPNKKTLHEKPLIGITIGDINGIGPEVIIKALSDQRILRFFTPVVYASAKIFGFYRKKIESNFVYHQIKNFDGINPKKVNVYNLWDETLSINPGEESEELATYTLKSLTTAAEDLKEGKIDAIVTAPLNKDLIHSEAFNFPGHTEYFAEKFDSKEHLMFMVSESLKIGVVTGHMPLKDVPGNISKEKIVKKLRVMCNSLKNDFGISKPRIAVLGLNPHAGEGGLLGKEEEEIILPAIQEFKEEGNLVFGPFPSDGFFGMMEFRRFDAVLAMYHDQGLTTFKYVAFEEGVNFTAGLPVVRTSPDHGTAYNIAGKNEANESSMKNAIYMATEILKCRQEAGLIQNTIST